MACPKRMKEIRVSYSTKESAESAHEQLAKDGWTCGPITQEGARGWTFVATYRLRPNVARRI